MRRLGAWRGQCRVFLQTWSLPPPHPGASGGAFTQCTGLLPRGVVCDGAGWFAAVRAGGRAGAHAWGPMGICPAPSPSPSSCAVSAESKNKQKCLSTGAHFLHPPLATQYGSRSLVGNNVNRRAKSAGGTLGLRPQP
eukprot:gene23665-biopygen11854